ncbi:Protein-tyrosine phosphatase, low molecular weight [Pseudodesulfovibrio mercurii]|uniref:Protein-tyrosine phosphatase, low molecular weight n=1 Tax=Pseudodesulfovibrio mercurii TaxID=641491 RepID=F0JC85_9BACT|nr:arsenate reductase ArsC [Pseudodesulfovibrio mercurii]EGB13220.1 Protein-tyrosine phosphatase, low molecular weight [Pseudodesulfovibrio mercurii]
MDPIRVLFVCRHNSGRSQMAEAFLQRLGRGRFEARSAGTEPTAVDPLVREVMREADFDFRNNVATNVRDLLRDTPPYHYVITTSGPDVLRDMPPLAGRTVHINWAFPDPEYVTGSTEDQLAAARAIRDDIRTQVIRFLHDQE